MPNQRQKTFTKFDEFTNLYELQKTLRFELKPVGRTKDLIEKNRVLEKDKLIDDNYHNIKYYFDLLHKKFIKETLSGIRIDLNNLGKYYKVLLVLDKDEENKVNLRKIESNLRKVIVANFNKKASEWKRAYNEKFKNQAEKIGAKKPVQLKGKEDKDIEILFEKDNLEILKYEFKEKPENDKIAPDLEFVDAKGNKKNLFEGFKGFTTYFTNFNNSRRNFYSEGEENTAVANRIINENLRRFCDNKKLFEQEKDRYQELGLSEEEKHIFDLDFYNNCLTQEGITKYNGIIGRRADKGSEGDKGINQKINEYRQKTKKKLQPFKKLYNQILGEKERFADRFVEITNDKHCFDVLKDFVGYADDKIKQAGDVFEYLNNNKNNPELGRIYLKQQAINTIAGKFFGSNSMQFKNCLPHRKTSNKEEQYKLNDFISLQEIKDGLSGNTPNAPRGFVYSNIAEIEPEDLFSEKYKDSFASNNWETFLSVWDNELNGNKEAYQECKEDLSTAIIERGRIERNRIVRKENGNGINETMIIKNYADAALAIFRMMGYFALEKGKKPVEDLPTDNNFYERFEEFYKDCKIVGYYNELRNYLTKKDFLGRLLFPSFGGRRKQKNPLSKRRIDGAEEILLNFDQSYDHKWEGLAFLFRKGNKYFIGIPAEGKNFVVKEIDNFSNGTNRFEQMRHTQLKWQTLVGKGYKSKFGCSYSDHSDSIAINNAKEIIKERYASQDRYKILKQVLEKNYQTKQDFRNEVGALLDELYGIDFFLVDEKDIMQQNQDGKIHLFVIANKDFRKAAEGSPNLHTEYFRLLFNTKKIKLNSALELYFRPGNKNLKKRKDKYGKEVIEHKRYSEDKYFLHLSIVLNFGKDRIQNRQSAIKGYARKFNSDLNSKILGNKVKIIGIDRGENNLAYYSVIKQNGDVIEAGSLNEIEEKDKNGRVVKEVNYFDLITKKTGDRDTARKNWQTIENIKELKNGYVSQLVRKICDLALKHNAIVIFEDLSIGFKRRRSALDFPIYQKLEMALIKKMNYLVNKNVSENEAGHYLNAYQLTSRVANPKDVGKQTGIIFYVPPSYTSITCPRCGFHKNISFCFTNKENAKKEIAKLKKFEYKKEKDGFEIEYRLGDFVKKQSNKQKKKDNELFADVPKKDKFILSTSGIIRYKWHNNNSERAKKEKYKGEFLLEEAKTKRGIVKGYNISEVLKSILEENGIVWHTKDLHKAIVEKDLSADFYKDLFYLFDLLLFSRVSYADNKDNEKMDYIHCPECGFDSRKGFQGQKDFCGDANGAYNIAKKGILVLMKIKQFKNNGGELEKLKWGDLAICLDEWDKFVQGQHKAS